MALYCRPSAIWRCFSYLSLLKQGLYTPEGPIPVLHNQVCFPVVTAQGGRSQTFYGKIHRAGSDQYRNIQLKATLAIPPQKVVTIQKHVPFTAYTRLWNVYLDVAQNNNLGMVCCDRNQLLNPLCFVCSCTGSPAKGRVSTCCYGLCTK